MRNVMRNIVRWLGGCAWILAFNPVLADPEGERAALARLIHELDALAPIIAEAQAQADPDATIRLEYAWLVDDLLRIRLGIREQLSATREQPRTFPPLKGDYRTR